MCLCFLIPTPLIPNPSFMCPLIPNPLIQVFWLALTLIPIYAYTHVRFNAFPDSRSAFRVPRLLFKVYLLHILIGIKIKTNRRCNAILSWYLAGANGGSLSACPVSRADPYVPPRFSVKVFLLLVFFGMLC